jgi:hypothetical protein
VPKTCADPSVATLCGQQSDGCGGLIAAPCVTCTGTQTCGGGGTPNQCGGAAGCVPATAAALCVAPDGGLAPNCGVFADGCGGTVSCAPDGGTCPTGETCGGAGIPNVCGSATIIPLDDGGTKIVDAGPPVCTKIPEATACNPSGTQPLCGPQSDGCGGTWTCATLADGGICAPGDSCGGGGTPSVCGHAVCTPSPVCTTGTGTPICGSVSNGCGGTYTCPPTVADGGICPAGETCGGDPSSPGTCGSPPCTPITTCPGGANCGTWPDGCGSTINCAPDGGTGCSGGEFCGGGGFSICGTGSGGGGPACDAGLKCDLTECDGGATATLRGTIYDPAVQSGTVGGSWPSFSHTKGNQLYNVVVYVPNTAPDALPHGQSTCESCASLFTGDPIVATTTDTEGNFTLSGVPVPTGPTTGPWGTLAAGQVPIVIQIGKWRREWVWPGVSTCGTTTATTAQEKSFLHLPGVESKATPSTTTTNDDLPQIAISTGSADSMECLFKRIGFQSSGSTNEYTCGAGGTGHLHIFQGGLGDSQNGNTVSGCSADSTASLWDSNADLNLYDILILSCEGAEAYNAVPQVLYNFAQIGGRAFASHYHYSWFSGPIQQTTWTYDGGVPAAWGSNLATWSGSSDPLCPSTTSAGNCNSNNNTYSWLNGKIVETLSDGGTPFHDWLSNVGALDVDPTGSGEAVADELNIQQPRMNAEVTSANVTTSGSNVWIVPDVDSNYDYYNSSGNYVTVPNDSAQYFSWNTPIGGTGDAAAPYCGRIVYSDLHVGGAAGDYGGGKTTPTDCASGNLTPQEKALEYMLLDLSSCVGSDTNLPPVTCSPTSCTAMGAMCGTIADGCGKTIDCGTCDAGTCIDNKCVTCTPLAACPKIDGGEVCGVWPDGCGGTLTCADCPTGSVCSDGVCISGCTPAASCPTGITCGVYSDGCGGTISCGPACGGGTTCGGGGTPGVCGSSDANACVPQACPPSIKCGPTGDGCGGVEDCGDCTPPLTCGGGGTPGVCGAPNCTPKTCADLGANCGQVADGCGGLTAVCGTCTGSATCGGGGTANVCGVPPCTPETCAQLGLNCGSIGDGCGNVLNCGTCAAPDTCGGGGTANVCGTGGPK